MSCTDCMILKGLRSCFLPDSAFQFLRVLTAYMQCVSDLPMLFAFLLPHTSWIQGLRCFSSQLFYLSGTLSELNEVCIGFYLCKTPGTRLYCSYELLGNGKEHAARRLSTEKWEQHCPRLIRTQTLEVLRRTPQILKLSCHLLDPRLWNTCKKS